MQEQKQLKENLENIATYEKKVLKQAKHPAKPVPSSLKWHKQNPICPTSHTQREGEGGTQPI